MVIVAAALKPGVHDFSDPYCAIVAHAEDRKIISRCCKVCGDTEDDGRCLGAKDWRAHNEGLDRQLTDSLARDKAPTSTQHNLPTSTNHPRQSHATSWGGIFSLRRGQ
jgi:hypothetical protein